MKSLKPVALFAALMLSLPAWAQPVDGEVTRIDAAQSRLTLRHGEIKHLDMPPMTMAFRVRDPKMLESLAKGDKVSFTVEKLEGHYVITSINKAQ